MGFRTVVILNNDTAHEWARDAELGNKIFAEGSLLGEFGDTKRFPYGQIFEVSHADVQTLAVLDGYSGQAISHTHWGPGRTATDRDLELLKSMANKMGYRISKKPVKNQE